MLQEGTGLVVDDPGAINGGSSSLPVIRLSELLPAQRAEVLAGALERYREGESLYEIAPSIGVSKTSLYRHLLNGELAEEWKEAKISHALAELEEAELGLKTAPDMLGITRARERARAAQWHLERLLRRMYGNDVPQDLAGRVNISINVGVVSKEHVVNQEVSVVK